MTYNYELFVSRMITWNSAEIVDLPNECPVYDSKQSDGEAPVMLELLEMWGTPSLPSLPGPFWPGVVATERVISMEELFDI